MRPDFRIFMVSHDRTPAQLRRDGFLLVPLGAIVSAIGAAMLALALGWQIPPDWLPDSIHAEPRTTPWQAPIGLVAFMSGVLFFGLVAIAEGLWRIFLGRMNTVLLRIMLALFAIFFVAGSIASMLLGRRYGQVGR
jgi:hypothetical protein